MHPHYITAAFRGGLALLALASAGQAVAQPVDPAPTLESLVGVRPPDPSGTEAGAPVVLSDYIRDRKAALMLGKAAFWDMALGSDGKTACASCHFNAGANARFKNTLAAESRMTALGTESEVALLSDVARLRDIDAL